MLRVERRHIHPQIFIPPCVYSDKTASRAVAFAHEPFNHGEEQSAHAVLLQRKRYPESAYLNRRKGGIGIIRHFPQGLPRSMVMASLASVANPKGVCGASTAMKA
jgi:hypothetical protein